MKLTLALVCGLCFFGGCSDDTQPTKTDAKVVVEAAVKKEASIAKEAAASQEAAPVKDAGVTQ